MKWFLKVLRQYADFSGRARRKEYWMFVLFYCIFLIAVIFIDAFISEIMDLRKPVTACSLTFALAMILPALAVVVRRLHDTGRSGWWILINLIPFVGTIWLLVLLMQDSQYDDNEYGENPKLSPQKPTEQARLTSLAVTVIVAAAWGILVDIVNIVDNAAIYNVIALVSLMLFLFIGIFLLQSNSYDEQPIEEARRKVSILLIIYGGVVTVLSLTYTIVFFDFFNISHVTFMLYSLAVLFFAIALATSNRNLLKAASVILIIFTSVEICLTIYVNTTNYHRMDSLEAVWITYRDLMPIFNISTIMLAAVFIPRATAAATASTVGGYSGQPSPGSDTGENVEPSQTVRYENLLNIKPGMTANELIAVAGLPTSKSSAAEIFIPLMGKVPAAEEGKGYWAYNTPFGDFQVAVRNSVIVGTSGLAQLKSPPEEEMS
jgi:uncharacterized membrane protein YhaH (DUF805 family)